MSEARRRDENSGLWFSPQPTVHGARNPDSVLFDLAKVAAAEPAPPTPPRLKGASSNGGSGLIDVATLAAASREVADAPPNSAPLFDLLPPLAPQPAAFTFVPPPAARANKPVMITLTVLLAILVALLAYVAAT